MIGASLPIAHIDMSGFGPSPDPTAVNSPFSPLFNQADEIVRRERLYESDNRTSSVTPSMGMANWVIPLPFMPSFTANGVPFPYNTDLVSFNYTCSWIASDNLTTSKIVTGGSRWTWKPTSNLTEAPITGGAMYDSKWIQHPRAHTG
ncbi:hypothetical protein AN958_01324 [Leucoagaricus sp. SymC.cos]|nr:hypothetical protein AN958_01324 [Leucoagaricus sp. SymC.cos]